MEAPQKSIVPFTPAMLVALFFVLTACGLLLGSIVSFSLVAVVMHLDFTEVANFMLSPGNLAVAQFANAVASIIGFAAPAYFIARMQGGNINERLGLNDYGAINKVLWVAFISIIGLVISGSLADITEKIPVSKDVKLWADSLENQYKMALKMMTQMNGVVDLLYTILAVALIPAFVEELFFRAALQKLLINWFKKPWIAIIVTALIFSAFHISYYGFLSRLSLGIILGVIYFITDSIWMPMLMHFINNVLGVITLFLLKNDLKKADEIIDGKLHYAWFFVALIVCVFSLLQLHKIVKNERLGKSI